MPFTRLPDGDVYAPEVGFSNGLPVARSAALHRMWLAHCYGMVGVGRDLDAESGSGAEMYVVIGHAPRHLDRNVALVGRVVKGVELLSGLAARQRGDGFLHARPKSRCRSSPSAWPRTCRPRNDPNLEVIRTDTPTFTALVESRRNRPEEFFKVPAGRIDLCNVPIPVRERAAR